MVALLGPGVRKENVDAAQVMRGQEVMKGVKGLKAQDVGVRDFEARAFGVETTHAAEHTFDAKELAFGMCRGARREEAALATTNLNFKRTRRVKFQCAARVRHMNDGPTGRFYFCFSHGRILYHIFTRSCEESF